TDLCRKEGIHPGIYYKWSKAFLEAGKQRLTGDTRIRNPLLKVTRQTSPRVSQVCQKIPKFARYCVRWLNQEKAEMLWESCC
ncbi:hypothetical protein ACFLR7_07010, partial [Acidobacteriota bacterium]